MKLLFLFLFIGFIVQAKASNYYFSSQSGDDTRTYLQAQNPSTPWKTLNKLNSFFSNFLPGDSILFKRGETFYGTIIATKSGTSSLPIIFSAYGIGAKPIISGLTNLASWINLGNGIWESAANNLCGERVNILTINLVSAPMGRYPNLGTANNGFLTYTSHSGTTSISDNTLAGTPNWTGAELILRKERWTFDKSLITNHSGSQLTYSTQTDYVPKDGFGYFIQNDIRTLDQVGEWYYNPNTKKVYLYYGNNTPPSNIQVSTVDNLVYILSKDYLHFDNISFTGSNTDTFEVGAVQNLQVTNCSISFAGDNGLFGFSLTEPVIENNSFSNINNNGILFYYNCPTPTIKNNIFKNIGLNMGMSTGLHYASCTAMTLTGEAGGCPNAMVVGNTIDSIGYIGISGGQESGLIQNNVVSNFCLVKDDGGGIYPGSGLPGAQMKVIGNIILDGKTAVEGTPYPTQNATWGIYVDDNGNNITVDGNTVSRMPMSGIFLHNAYSITVTNNVSYNNKEAQLSLAHDISTTHDLQYLNINNNIFGITTGQLAIKLYTTTNFSGISGINYNHYSIPVSETAPFYTFLPSDQGTFRTFINYKSLLNIEQNSTISSSAPVLFQYNTTSAPLTVTIPPNYTDLLGTTTYTTGNVSLAPYRSNLFIPGLCYDLIGKKPNIIIY